MAYEKTNWVNDETPLNAENMNKIENGIEQNANDAEAIRDNTTQIVPTSGGLAIGGALKPSNKYAIAIGENGTRALQSGDIAIGHNAICYTSGNYKVAIGNNAQANKQNSIAIGNGAQTSEVNAIQLGYGTNNTANSLQIANDNIYKTDTHTLTVQNIELNGVDLGTLLGDLNTALETILGV